MPIVATANVLGRLSEQRAREALAATLTHQPTIVGLQEWSRKRKPLLREAGRVRRFPKLRNRPNAQSGYEWAYPLGGGQPVGVDAAWGHIVAVRSLLLARARDGVRATKGTEALVIEHATGRLHAVLNIHLVAHHHRPANLRAWREGVATVEAWAESWHGLPRWVLGDVNKHDLDLSPLVSCWAGNRLRPTFANRAIDGVWSDKRATSVTVINTPSDHHSVVAQYANEETP